jgi:hypothetical protein
MVGDLKKTSFVSLAQVNKNNTNILQCVCLHVEANYDTVSCEGVVHLHYD